MNAKQLILNTIDDLCRDFLYYDRKQDEDLSVQDITDAIETGTITVDEMVDQFRKALEGQLAK